MSTMATAAIGRRTNTAPEPVYKVNEVAAHLGVDKNTVYSLIHAGHLRALRLGRALRITESALAEFLASAGGATE